MEHTFLLPPNTHTHSLLVISLSLKAFFCWLRHILIAKISLLLFGLVLYVADSVARLSLHNVKRILSLRDLQEMKVEKMSDEKMIKNVYELVGDL